MTGPCQYGTEMLGQVTCREPVTVQMVAGCVHEHAYDVLFCARHEAEQLRFYSRDRGRCAGSPSFPATCELPPGLSCYLCETGPEPHHCHVRVIGVHPPTASPKVAR